MATSGARQEQGMSVVPSAEVGTWLGSEERERILPPRSLTGALQARGRGLWDPGGDPGAGRRGGSGLSSPVVSASRPSLASHS